VFLKIKKLNFILSVLVFLVTAQNTTFGANWNTEKFREKDWTHKFQPACNSENSDIQKFEEEKTNFVRFTLKEKAKKTDKCRHDSYLRHSAPFWERAELHIDKNFNFAINQEYEIEYRIRFVEGFKNDRETIFQIHGGCPNQKKWNECFVPIMIKIDAKSDTKSGLYVAYLEKDYRYGHLYSEPWNRSAQSFDPTKHLGEWITIKMSFNRKDKTTAAFNISLKTKDDEWTANIQKFSMHPDIKPFVKVGLYRPAQATLKDLSGTDHSYPNYAQLLPNVTTILDVDYIKISKK